MKLLLGAAVAVLLMASPAMAQTDAAPASCGTMAAAPGDQPDGATASREVLEAYTQRFNAWAEAANQVLSCKRIRAEEALARANAMTAEFNTENTALRAAIDTWTAEVNEFNARGPARRERDPRSVVNR